MPFNWMKNGHFSDCFFLLFFETDIVTMSPRNIMEDLFEIQAYDLNENDIDARLPYIAEAIGSGELIMITYSKLVTTSIIIPLPPSPSPPRPPSLP